MNTPFLKDLADKARCGLRGHVELGNPGGLGYGFTVKCATGDGTAMANAKSFRPKRK
jgi:hypothetical protein